MQKKRKLFVFGNLTIKIVIGRHYCPFFVTNFLFMILWYLTGNDGYYDKDAGEEANEGAELHDGWEHYQHVDGLRHVLWDLRERLKPEDREHGLRQVLEQIFDSFHLPELDIKLESDVDLERDGGHRLHPEDGVVSVRVGAEAVLELP